MDLRLKVTVLIVYYNFIDTNLPKQINELIECGGNYNTPRKKANGDHVKKCKNVQKQ